MAEQDFLSEADWRSVPAIENDVFTGSCRPLVSVLMLTRNHDAFVAQAIDSIVAQQTGFAVELLIGEDSSNDATRKICLEYQQRFPAHIRLIVADGQVGMHANFARLWTRARGKYIAFCEGDDYWCDPYKLSKQVSWLESRPEFSLCGTYTETLSMNANGAWECGAVIKPLRVKERYHLEDLLPDYSFHFSSVMLRKDSVQFPKWFWDVYCVDRPLYLLAAVNGPAGLLPEVTSRYRQHQGGVWSSLGLLQKAESSAKLFETLNTHFHYRYNAIINQTLGNILWSYLAQALNNVDTATAKHLFWRALHFGAAGLLRRQPWLVLAVGLRLYLPGLYSTLKTLQGDGRPADA